MIGDREYIAYWQRETTRTYTKQLTFQDLNLKLPPNVFDPDPQITYSTSIITDHFPNVQNKSVLDLGTGSGVLAMYAKKSNAKLVVASDIDTKVLRATKENFKQNKLEKDIVLIWSDLFQNIFTPFDFIFANLPILDDEAFETHCRLLRYYRRHLNKHGELWLSYASFGDNRFTNDFIARHAKIKDVKDIKSFGINWYLYIIK